MENISKGPTIVTQIDYCPHAILQKTIVEKITGTIRLMSFDSGEGVSEKISPFERFAQIIDGKAEIVIDGTSHFLEAGEGMILPAHIATDYRANERFKMIVTIIKSGYE